MRTEEQLLQELQAKDAELVSLVANVLGLGDLGDLNDGRRKELEGEVAELREKYKTTTDGDTPENPQALNERFGTPALGRLLRERREISEQILDLRDDG